MEQKKTKYKNGNSPTSYPPQKRMAVIKDWVNNPTLSYTAICQRNHIAQHTFYMWRHDQEFMQAYHEESEKRFRQLQALAVQKLKEELDKNAWNAIKYVLDNKGYNAAQKIETNAPTTISVTIEEKDAETVNH